MLIIRFKIMEKKFYDINYYAIRFDEKPLKLSNFLNEVHLLRGWCVYLWVLVPVYERRKKNYVTTRVNALFY